MSALSWIYLVILCCWFGLVDVLSLLTSWSGWVVHRLCVGWMFWVWEVKNGGPKSRKNGPRVWAFCKIEFPGIQKPVQILAQKMGFFGNPGNRGVGVIWLVRGGFWCWVVAYVGFYTLVFCFVGGCCWGLVGVCVVLMF